MSRVDVTLGMKNAPFKKGVEAAKTQIRGLKKVASGGFSFGKVVGEELEEGLVGGRDGRHGEGGVALAARRLDEVHGPG